MMTMTSVPPMNTGTEWSVAEIMWTLILVTVALAGSVTGGVATSTTFLDFADEAKCKTAAERLIPLTQVCLDVVC
jgi:D-arabinose 1-dehydrogenase-like Zn-dependent alcohol dehydrogenase